MSSETIGSMSLTSFCACPDPCDDCCVACCPTVLITNPVFASIVITAIGPCACASDFSMQLDWNSTSRKWEGSHAFGTCGTTLQLKFYCVDGGTNASGMRLDIDLCSGTFTTLTPSGSPTCDPLNIEFIPPFSTTCCPALDGISTVTVTL